MDPSFISQTALDQMLSSDSDQMMKAAIPYLPPRGQQFLSVYEKIRELRNALTLFSHPQSGISMCATPSAEPLEALTDIQRFCYGKSRQRLDGVLNLMAFAQMLKLMNAPVPEEKPDKEPPFQQSPSTNSNIQEDPL